MKKLLGSLLIITGAVLIIISIMGLVKAFDVFTSMVPSSENIAYIFGSILFPLLVTVTGRWIYRKGVNMWKGIKG